MPAEDIAPAPPGFAEVTPISPFVSFVGPIYLRWDGGAQHATFRVEPRHRNVFGHAHGGMVMTFADILLGNAAKRVLGDRPAVTLNLSTIFIRPSKVGDWVTGRAEARPAGPDLAYASGRIESGEGLALTVEGMFKAVGARDLPRGVAPADGGFVHPDFKVAHVNTFTDNVGPFYRRFEDDNMLIGLRIEPRHANRHGLAHGGVLMTFADALIGRTARRKATYGSVTLRMVGNFIGAPRVGDWVEGRCRITRIDGPLIHLTGTATVRDRLVMAANAVFSMVEERKFPRVA